MKNLGKSMDTEKVKTLKEVRLDFKARMLELRKKKINLLAQLRKGLEKKRVEEIKRSLFKS